MKDLMNLAEYARFRKARRLPGGTTQAVLDAVNAGRIGHVLIGKSKFVRPAQADQQWLATTDMTRYTPEQWAAIERATTPPSPPAAPAGATADRALSLCFANAGVAAASLVEQLDMEPLAALRAATYAVSGLCFAVAELLGCQSYLDGSSPGWAVALIEGRHDDPELVAQLENVAEMAVDLFGDPEVSPPTGQGVNQSEDKS